MANPFLPPLGQRRHMCYHGWTLEEQINLSCADSDAAVAEVGVGGDGTEGCALL